MGTKNIPEIRKVGLRLQDREADDSDQTQCRELLSTYMENKYYCGTETNTHVSK